MTTDSTGAASLGPSRVEHPIPAENETVTATRNSGWMSTRPNAADRTNGGSVFEYAWRRAE